MSFHPYLYRKSKEYNCPHLPPTTACANATPTQPCKPLHSHSLHPTPPPSHCALALLPVPPTQPLCTLVLLPVHTPPPHSHCALVILPLTPCPHSQCAQALFLASPVCSIKISCFVLASNWV